MLELPQEAAHNLAQLGEPEKNKPEEPTDGNKEDSDEDEEDVLFNGIQPTPEPIQDHPCDFSKATEIQHSIMHYRAYWECRKHKKDGNPI